MFKILSFATAWLGIFLLSWFVIKHSKMPFPTVWWHRFLLSQENSMVVKCILQPCSLVLLHSTDFFLVVVKWTLQPCHAFLYHFKLISWTVGKRIFQWCMFINISLFYFSLYNRWYINFPTMRNNSSLARHPTVENLLLQSLFLHFSNRGILQLSTIISLFLKPMVGYYCFQPW